MLGPAELPLPSSSKQSNLLASFPFVHAHDNPHCLELISSPPLLFPIRATLWSRYISYTLLW